MRKATCCHWAPSESFFDYCLNIWQIVEVIECRNSVPTNTVQFFIGEFTDICKNSQSKQKCLQRSGSRPAPSFKHCTDHISCLVVGELRFLLSLDHLCCKAIWSSAFL